MQAGAMRPIGTILAGGWLVLVVSGCGNTDSPSDPEWTSTAPASIPSVESTTPSDDPDVTVTTSGEVVTTAAVTTTTTEVPGETTTTVPSTSTTAAPVVTGSTDPPAGEEESPDEAADEVAGKTDAEDKEERVITHPDIVMSNDYWEEMGLPDPAAPPVDDPERISYAEDQIRKIYFKWFDGIYRKDPETLWEAVATEGSYERGIGAMENMTFTAPPTLEGVEVEVLELYVDHPECLVAAFEIDIKAFRDTSGPRSSVIIMWPDPSYGWRRNITFGLPTIYGMWWENCFIAERPDFP